MFNVEVQVVGPVDLDVAALAVCATLQLLHIHVVWLLFGIRL